MFLAKHHEFYSTQDMPSDYCTESVAIKSKYICEAVLGTYKLTEKYVHTARDPSYKNSC